MDKLSLAVKSWLRQFIYSVQIVLILLRSVLQQHVAKAVCILSRKNWSFGCKVVYFEGLAPVFCERITILAESEIKRPILWFGYKSMSRLNFAKWNLYLLKSSGSKPHITVKFHICLLSLSEKLSGLTVVLPHNL